MSNDQTITMNRVVTAHAMGGEIKIGQNLDSGIYADMYSVPIVWTKTRIFKSRDGHSIFIFNDHTKDVIVCQLGTDGYYEESSVMTYADWIDPMA